ncbi:hypothetical protein [Prosthecobacter fluviatilis]|uniref:DUF1634 domain-containing protein n=1 Tax=Prosthecobacter fluviatilis TaxID=445931 RepID=A0ABW0KLC6_9BACT
MNLYQTPQSESDTPHGLLQTRQRCFEFGRALALLMCVYSVVAWYGTELVFDWGASIEAWRTEYYGDDNTPSGSMKFRGPEGKLIYLMAPWSLLLYPAALLAFVLLARLSFKDTSTYHKMMHGLCALAMVAILARLCHLGVFSCIMQSL